MVNKVVTLTIAYTVHSKTSDHIFTRKIYCLIHHIVEIANLHLHKIYMQ